MSWITLPGGRQVDGYNGLAVPCPRCGDDVIFHIDRTPHGELSPTFSEQPCGCRLTPKQRLGLWDRAEEALERLERGQ